MNKSVNEGAAGAGEDKGESEIERENVGGNVNENVEENVEANISKNVNEDSITTRVFPSLATYLETEALPNGRLIALDVGDKCIGVAISDTLRMIASPYALYERKSFAKDGDFLKNLVEKEDAVALILGNPLNLSGQVGGQGEKTRYFAAKISQKISAPILLWDERFSTQAVEKMMLSFDTSRKKRSALIDKLSATYILQGVLDYLSRR